MTVRWSEEAVEDLVALRAYIGVDDTTIAQRMALHIIRCIEVLLAENSDLGRPGRVPGTRELVIAQTPFIVPYRVRGRRIEVLRVYHAARRWPERL